MTDIYRPMFGGLDTELRAAFGSNTEPRQLSYTVKNTGVTLESQLGPCLDGNSTGSGSSSRMTEAGCSSMAQSLGDMMMNKSMQQKTSAVTEEKDLNKYNNMQKFMTSALCKSTQQQQSNNNNPTIPQLCDMDLLESNIQHRYQNSHHCGFEGTSVDVRPYAVGIYDFFPQYENELGFKKGDMIFLLKHVDDDWIEGELDGEKGIFPRSYVNIVVDCAKIQEEKPELAELEKLLCDSFYLQTGAWYKVVFSFTGEREGDLGVQMGELVRVVSHSDTHWCWVMNTRYLTEILIKLNLYESHIN